MTGLKKISVLALVVAVLAYVYKTFIQKPLPLNFGGTFHPDFQEVADLYKAKLRSGVEVGSSFAAYYKGEPLVDIWGGHADVATRRPWTKDTLSIIFSSSKGVTALLVALFVDRGWLDYNKPVAHYWPEFGQNGKDNITVALLISHQGGLSVTNGTIPMEWIVEKPEKVWEFLEKQRPIWPPGTGYGYHGITFGLYVDSLLTKADPKHRRVDKIFQEEIGDKFGIELYNGLPNHLFYRATRHEPNPLYVTLWNVITYMDLEPISLIATLALSTNPLLTKMASSGTDQLPSDLSFNTPEYSKIPQSSMNGYSNARNLAKLFGIVANGGKTKEGILLSEKVIELLKQPLTSGKSMDGVINIEFGYGVGIGKDDKGNIVFGHDGAGGQSAFADPAHKTGMAYVTSRLKSMTISGDKEFLQYKAAYYRCLEKFLQKTT
ncbi:beta-lactamase domain-containing protein 2-like [Saccostrea echinata]|uniref:beta-lactamase domain-containing protein 2-like n=1 Tax=Saccostrea echinata TaxID=191078 RepID=UPI002A81A786|nr:beta-lactamase domain-containing protein 2-like [Saccostrea echinata]